MSDRTKLLAWGDYACSTGFATVMGNILRELDKTGRFDITVVGVNYLGTPYDRERWPGEIWPALIPGAFDGPYTDVHGRQRVLDLLGSGQFDVFFFIQDTFIARDIMAQINEAQEQLAHKFKTVYYFPIDAQPKAEWITDVVAKADFPVAYTNYAKREAVKAEPSLSERLQVIYHGTNTTDFHYVQDRELVRDFRTRWFDGLTDGKFLVTNVNRNQARKDIMRSLMVLRQLRDRGIEDVVFYLHMQVSDVGGNIMVMANNLGLEPERDFILPHPKIFSSNQGIPIASLNLLYNASDAVFTSTLGEGWGLSVTEAMATKTPVIAPDHTSLTEMLANKRGILIPAGQNSSMWGMKEMDNERLRPLMDVQAAAQAIIDLQAGKQTPDIDNAYAWARQLNWTNVVAQWLPIIDQAAEEARAATKQAEPASPNRSQRRARARH